MAKKTTPTTTPPEAVISIIGVGMTLVGDTDTDGSLRIEGTVRGSVRAGKSVVVGRGGLVDGSVFTQDAVIAGRVSGGIHAESRLELQATSEVSGEIVAPRMQVEEGAKVQGLVAIGASEMKATSKTANTEKVGGGGKTERQTEPEEVTSKGKADGKTETKQNDGPGKADAQPGQEPEGKAERHTGEKQPTESEFETGQQQRSRD
jgi:cytoskeletal protein CcmA (bactofilin family)